MMILVDVPSSKDRIVTHLSVWKPVLLGPNNSRIVETTTTLFEGAVYLFITRERVGEGKLDPEIQKYLSSYGRARYCGHILHSRYDRRIERDQIHAKKLSTHHDPVDTHVKQTRVR